MADGGQGSSGASLLWAWGQSRPNRAPLPLGRSLNVGKNDVPGVSPQGLSGPAHSACLVAHPLVILCLALGLGHSWHCPLPVHHGTCCVLRAHLDEVTAEQHRLHCHSKHCSCGQSRISSCTHPAGECQVGRTAVTALAVTTPGHGGTICGQACPVPSSPTATRRATRRAPRRATEGAAGALPRGCHGADGTESLCGGWLGPSGVAVAAQKERLLPGHLLRGSGDSVLGDTVLGDTVLGDANTGCFRGVRGLRSRPAGGHRLLGDGLEVTNPGRTTDYWFVLDVTYGAAL